MGFVYSLPVRFADTDAQGHVFFANYLTFCDEAMSAWLRHVGWPWPTLVASGVELVYRGATAEYLGSARFEDVLDLEITSVRAGRTSLTFEIDARRGPDVVHRAKLTSVCVDAVTRRPVPLPEGLRAAASG